MTKAELIARITERTGITKSQADEVLSEISDSAQIALKSGTEFPLPGIGKLKVKRTKARTGRNPKNGEPVQIAAKTSAKFVAAKELKDALNK